MNRKRKLEKQSDLVFRRNEEEREMVEIFKEMAKEKTFYVPNDEEMENLMKLAERHEEEEKLDQEGFE